MRIPNNVNLLDEPIRKRLGVFTITLTASLLMTAGCVRDEHDTRSPSPVVHSQHHDPDHRQSQRPPAPVHSELENSGRNRRDKDDATLTASDQKENQGDLDITATIRRAVLKHKSLSHNAHNAKIITRDGVVTLPGPVKNGSEKITLESIAQKTRGVVRVNNQLEPKTP